MTTRGGTYYRIRVAWLVGLIGLAAAGAHAQLQMPDPREMSGIPRPVTDLPDQSVSVRLILGELSNNITDHPVELEVDGEVRTVRTDADGRAQFDDIPTGARLKALAVVNDERLESAEFAVPSQGGIRMLLVATDPQRAALASAPAIPGEVVLGRESRIVVEPEEERVRVYYLLDIVNNTGTPVSPPTPIIFDTPTGALGTTIVQGSSPQASASGDTVRVLGPFAPGQTSVQVAFILPAPNGVVELTQAFPAAVEQLVVFLPKVGNATLTSDSFTRQQEMPAGGDVLIVGVSDQTIPAGESISLRVGGLPHHSTTGRSVALSLGVLISLIGAGVAWRSSGPADQAAARKRLIASRERLFQDLVRLEHDRKRGRADEGQYTARRHEFLAALEHVYGELDTIDVGPGPDDRAGVAA